MKENRYSQDMLARELEVSQNLVGLWSRGKSIPDLKKARSIAKIFGVSVDFLADDELDDSEEFFESDALREVWRIVQQVGPDEAWRRLVTNASLPVIEPRNVIPPQATPKKGVG